MTVVSRTTVNKYFLQYMLAQVKDGNAFLCFGFDTSVSNLLKLHVFGMY